MSEQQAWDRQEGEPLNWHTRFTRFRLMEPVRTIAAVFQEEYSQKLAKTRKEVRPDGTWHAMAKQWRWEERAEAWDAYQASIEEKHIEKEKAKVLRQRYALMHKRVQELDRLAQKLIDYAESEERVWLPDVKAIGNGPDAERVDLVQFNADLFKEIREYLTDLAEETGGRVKKSETTLKSLPKIYLDLDPDEDGSVE